MSNLDKEIIIRRLAIIKYLYNLGAQQSMQVDMVAGFSILSFHDCAEMFLLLVAENKGMKGENVFMDYWNKIPELTLKESMRIFKERRVNIKHKGLFPSKNDVEISRITMADFLSQNTKIQFGLDFSSVSVSSLISYNEVKTYIDVAEEYLVKNDFYNCMVNAKIAFMELLSSYEDTKRGKYHVNSITDVGRKIGNEYQKLIGHDEKSGARWFRDVSETTNRIREVLKITALGIDYRKYAFFEYITPETNVYWSNGCCEYHSIPKDYYESKINLRASDCRFCIDFVIDSALKLQEFDYDISNLIK